MLPILKTAFRRRPGPYSRMELLARVTILIALLIPAVQLIRNTVHPAARENIAEQIDMAVSNYSKSGASDPNQWELGKPDREKSAGSSGLTEYQWADWEQSVGHFQTTTEDHEQPATKRRKNAP